MKIAGDELRNGLDTAINWCSGDHIFVAEDSPLMPQPLHESDLHYHFSDQVMSNNRKGVYHHTPEVFIQIEGATLFTFPNQEFLLEPGQILVIPARLPHTELIKEIDGQFQNQVVWFHKGRVNVHIAELNEKKRVHVVYAENFEEQSRHPLRSYLNEFTEISNWARKREKEASKAIMTLFLLKLKRQLSDELKIKPSISKISRVKELAITQSHDVSMNVASIARQLNYSADYLSHLYYQETGERLSSFLKNCRMDHAAKLLKSTDLTISEVAWYSGYSDPKYFSRVFKSHYNCSPKQFRHK